MIFGTSIVIWLMETVKYWFVMQAFDFRVSFLVLMLMNGLVNLATSLPAAPGYVGTFDWPGIETLKTFGVPDTLAAGYTDHAPRRALAAGDAGGRLLFLARAAALGRF